MIKYIEGDIFKGLDDVIVHGCNCFCNFGKGIAYTVSQLYPEAYMIDKKTKYNDSTKLGSFTSWSGENVYDRSKTVTIVNAYTQFYPNVKMKPFDYEAFERVLPKIKEFIGNRSIAMPKIGAGLAGGNWDEISKMIDKCFGDKEVKIYLYKG